jgi:hypothetical protein
MKMKNMKMKNMKMKKVVVLIAFVASLGLVCLTNPGSGVANGAEGVRDQNTTDNADVLLPSVDQYTHFLNAAHVANGIALRGRLSGTIHLRGVPAGRALIAAYLYWNYSDGASVGGTAAAALFNGNSVTGAKTADNIDPCWGRSGNHTYRANVTAFMPGANPNQDYEVVTGISGSTNGSNPWLSTPPSPARLQEGATLVVVFANQGTAVVIYDALSGTEFSSSLTVTLLHPISLSGTGLYTMSGADGQRGAIGYTNANSNERGYFNATQTSGPIVAASDWDGSAGWPLPQLWDVHTHEVRYTAGSSTVRYTAGTDCLVPVVFVLQANTP